MWSQNGGQYKLYNTANGYWAIGVSVTGAWPNDIQGIAANGGLTPQIYDPTGWSFYNASTNSYETDMNADIHVSTSIPIETPIYCKAPAVLADKAGAYNFTGFLNGIPFWKQQAGNNIVYGSSGKWKVGLSSLPADVAVGSTSAPLTSMMGPEFYTGAWQYFDAGSHSWVPIVLGSFTFSKRFLFTTPLYLTSITASVAEGRYDVSSAYGFANSVPIWRQCGGNNLLYLDDTGRWSVGPSLSASDAIVRSFGAFDGLQPEAYSAGWQTLASPTASWMADAGVTFTATAPYNSPLYLTSLTQQLDKVGRYDVDCTKGLVNGLPVWSQS